MDIFFLSGLSGMSLGDGASISIDRSEKEPPDVVKSTLEKVGTTTIVPDPVSFGYETFSFWWIQSRKNQ